MVKFYLYTAHPRPSLAELMRCVWSDDVLHRRGVTNSLWDWKDPKKSKAVMYILIFATILFLFVSFWLCFRYALLCLGTHSQNTGSPSNELFKSTNSWCVMCCSGVYMFTLNPLYNKFPRFKRRYHVSILIKRLKNQIIPVRAPSRTPRFRMLQPTVTQSTVCSRHSTPWPSSWSSSASAMPCPPRTRYTS